jgi:arginyl-tRNA synthetase
MLRPLPQNFGVGFTTSSESDLKDLDLSGYRCEKIGMHTNYHATVENWAWPNKIKIPATKFVIDGFSPNLNKSFHVGHLRNLAIANSLSKILTVRDGRRAETCDYNTKFVAMLGASLGVKKFALDGWRYWTGFLGYKPEEYFDITLPDDIIETRDYHEYQGVVEPGPEIPQAWDGPYGAVIVKRSDGRSLYAFHDLTFAAYVGPTHYITGHEQKEHFMSLGLGDKHLPMGLVLGEDNKKLKSRTGDALPATEVMDMLISRLEGELDVRTKLAWNILAWNFLHTTREKNIKFEVESWTRPEQGGLYISYTYARAVSALGKKDQTLIKLYREQMLTKFNDIDISLLGFAEQYRFYYQEAVNRMDSAPIANFAFDLAKLISQAYEKEKVDGGRRSFSQAFEHATWRLEMCMRDLGMFRLYEV